MRAVATDADPLVLVVDDQPAVREMVRRTLEGGGYRVGAVEDIERGRQLLAQEPVSAIVLDVHLAQNRSGLELLEWVRVSGAVPQIPVLVLTGYQMTIDEEAAIRRYGAYVFYKTEGLAALRDYLDRLLRGGGSDLIPTRTRT